VASNHGELHVGDGRRELPAKSGTGSSVQNSSTITYPVTAMADFSRQFSFNKYISAQHTCI